MRQATIAIATTAALWTSAAWGGESVVHLEGQPNFRDIGGYETTDGQRVKRGLIYRSGELPRLTDEDVEKLRALGIKTVINFLTPEEIEYRGRDRLPDDIREISLPITGEVANVPDAAAQIVEARKTGDFREFPPAFNPLIHNDLVSGVADTQYRALFDLLSDESNYPLVYHCSHGVHRTGTATALLLSALNVPWDKVREDYLLSNATRGPEVRSRIDQLEALATSLPISNEDRKANSEAIRAFYVLQPDYIDASRDGAERMYGSLDRYLAEQLGVSNQRKSKLRELLTVPKDMKDTADALPN